MYPVGYIIYIEGEGKRVPHRHKGEDNMKNFKIVTNAQDIETTVNEILEEEDIIESENAESAVAEYAQWFFDESNSNSNYETIEINNETNEVTVNNTVYSFWATEIEE